MNLPSGRGRGRRAPVADINVTPLVDVMLVLLIIFMVTAPLLTAGVPVNLPDSKAKPVQQDHEPVQLSIDRTGRIFVDRDEVSEAALGSRLDALVQRTPGEPPQVYLRADRGLDYGRVMRVMGELDRAGLTKVALISTPGGEAEATR